MKIKTSRLISVLSGALAYLAFCVFYLIPLVFTFVYAFLKSPFQMEFHVFDNFSYLIGNRYFRLGFQNLLVLGLSMALLSFLCSILIAPVLSANPRLAGLAIIILILPVVIPSVSASAVWKNVFETRSILESGKARLALLSLFVWKYAGLGSAVLFSGLKRIPESLTDAAKIDGAKSIRTYFSIRLPAIPGEMGAVIGLNIVFMLRLYKESYLLFGAYPSGKAYMLQNYMNHQYTNMSFQYVAASAVILIAFAVLLYAIVYFILIKRRGAL